MTKTGKNKPVAHSARSGFLLSIFPSANLFSFIFNLFLFLLFLSSSAPCTPELVPNSSGSAVAAYSAVNISPYDRVYEDLRYLQTYGLIASLNLDQLPITNLDLQSALQKDKESGSIDRASPQNQAIIARIIRDYGLSDEPDKRDMLSRLKKKFLSFLSGETADEPILTVGGTMDLSMKTGESTKLYPLARTYIAAELPFDMSFVNVMALDPYATESSNYIGNKWRGLSGYTEQAYMLWRPSFLRNKSIETRIIAGRCYLANGPGRKGGLLFSSTYRPMDQARFEFSAKRFAFQSMTAKLDPMNGSNRYLSMHRLTLFFQNLQVAVNEVSLYNGVNRNVEWAYLNPFVFYHGEQMNGPNLDCNTLGSVDFYYAGKKWGLYGELLIDDIQLDKKEPGDLEPNEIGGLLGIDIADPFGIAGMYIGCEYAAITNRTYKTTNAAEYFVHRNAPIGYSLGSDLDRWNLNVKKTIGKWQAIGELDVLRKGEGEMDLAFDEPWMNYTVKEGYSESFPTGIVENTVDVGLELRYFPDYDRYCFIAMNYRNISNVDHGSWNDKDFILTAGIHWTVKTR